MGAARALLTAWFAVIAMPTAAQEKPAERMTPDEF